MCDLGMLSLCALWVHIVHRGVLSDLCKCLVHHWLLCGLGILSLSLLCGCIVQGGGEMFDLSLYFTHFAV